MSEHDAEIEWLKASVSCAVLLERLPPVWRLDAAESSRRSLKYRRGEGEIVIVNHDGRGWWDPLSDHKGDIFTLVRHLDPGLSFPAARGVVREFARLSRDAPDAAGTSVQRLSHRTLGATPVPHARVGGVALPNGTTRTAGIHRPGGGRR
jgi:hypothetical protein